MRGVGGGKSLPVNLRPGCDAYVLASVLIGVLISVLIGPVPLE